MFTFAEKPKIMEEKKRVRPTVGQVKALEERIAELASQIHTLEMSNSAMEQELAVQREHAKMSNLNCKRANDEIVRLKQRNLWQRILNS